MSPASRPVLSCAAAGLVALALGSSTAHAQTTALYVDSQAGDYVGQGRTQTFTAPDLAVTARSFGPGRIVITAETADASTSWVLRFGVPDGTGLQPGVYENAVRFAFSTGASPELDVAGNGFGCSQVAGRFVLYEVTFDVVGVVTSFAADFEQHCERRTPALFGAIRFNSNRASLNPFDGAYPVYSLEMQAAVNGYVTGPGIDCGAGRVDCDEVYAPNTVVALQAVPLPGYVFVGWAGDCVGDHVATVVIQWRRFCAPVFNVTPGGSGVESPDYSQGALVLEGKFWAPDASLPAHPRPRHVYVAAAPGSPLRSLLTPSVQAGNVSARVQFAVDAPGGRRIHLLFAAPPGTDLAPGDYEFTSTTDDPTAPVPRLQLSAFADFSGAAQCTGGGRFRVYEYGFDTTTASVASFAADFELPCGPPGTLVAGSIRYRSTRASLVPFDGAYPRYALRIVPTLGGYVTSTGILCGDDDRTDCDETYTTPTVAVVEAFPSSGYRFVGWSGSCSDANATTVVFLDAVKRCFAVFTPDFGESLPEDPSLATGTLFIERLGSVSPPVSTIWLAADATIRASGSGSRLFISFTSNSSGASTDISFGTSNPFLGSGEYEYEHATASGFTLSGCSGGARFRIYDLAVDSNGRLTFAADFEALCGSPAQRVIGAVRINSTRASIVPFGGDYPIWRLTIEPAVNGIVTADEIECGPGRVDCVERFGSPANVTLHAVPLAGYRFVGWSGSCQGASITTIAVDWIRRCTAVFNAIAPGFGVEDPRVRAVAFMVESQPGDPVGQGRRRIWLDATMRIFSSFDRRRLTVNLESPDGDYWGADLQAPAGEQLHAGSYENAVELFRATSSPGIRISSRSGFCSASVVGRFVIHEIAFTSDTFPAVTTLAADFEQQCVPGGPRLRGSIRFQSTRSILEPFAPSTFTPVPLPLSSDFNGDGWADLVWRHDISGRNAIWLMDGINASLTTLLNPSNAAVVPPNSMWEIRAVGDVNGDATPDLIWQKSDTGRIAVWFFQGTTRIGTDYLYTAALSSFEPDLLWKIVAAGDMNRDGQVDLVWRHTLTGEIRLWHMLGNTQWDSVTVGTVDALWKIVGLADMNGDGMLDIVWRHAATGRMAAWFMFDALVQATLRLSPAELADTNWRIVGVVDMNNDQKPDLVWQNVFTGGLGVWFMDGISMMSGRYLNPAAVSDPQWRIVGVK